jgi:hypothetical protein
MVKSRKVHKLEVEPDFSFILIGISSHESDYKLIWSLNSKLELNLSRGPNLVFADPKSEQNQEFSCYYGESKEGDFQIHLLSNKSENGFLIPELGNIDYFLKLTGEVYDLHKKKILDGLKETGLVLATFLIQPDTLKSKSRLVF